MFQLRKFLVLNRLWLAIIFIGLGIWWGVAQSWWLGWLPIFIGALMIVAHFMLGPVTLMQNYIESGDVEGAQKLLKTVKYPNLLYKPIRSAYYMLKSNFSTMTENFDDAEQEIKKGLEAGVTDKDFQGTAYLQLGAIAYRKGNKKEAFEHLKAAIKAGLPDADSWATAYFQLSSLSMERRDFRGAKTFYQKAVAAKPTNPQLVEQLTEMKKYISRMPG